MRLVAPWSLAVVLSGISIYSCLGGKIGGSIENEDESAFVRADGQSVTLSSLKGVGHTRAPELARFESVPDMDVCKSVPETIEAIFELAPGEATKVLTIIERLQEGSVTIANLTSSIPEPLTAMLSSRIVAGALSELMEPSHLEAAGTLGLYKINAPPDVSLGAALCAGIDFDRRTGPGGNATDWAYCRLVDLLAMILGCLPTHRLQQNFAELYGLAPPPFESNLQEDLNAFFDISKIAPVAAFVEGHKDMFRRIYFSILLLTAAPALTYYNENKLFEDEKINLQEPFPGLFLKHIVSTVMAGRPGLINAGSTLPLRKDFPVAMLAASGSGCSAMWFFRGTLHPLEWKANFNYQKQPLNLSFLSGANDEEMYSLAGMTIHADAVHGSLLRETRKLYNECHASNTGEPFRVTMAGHSLGASLASVNALRIKDELPSDAQVAFIGYAAPRVFSEKASALLGSSISTVTLRAASDTIPQFPCEEMVSCARSGSTIPGEGRYKYAGYPSHREVVVQAEDLPEDSPLVSKKFIEIDFAKLALTIYTPGALQTGAQHTCALVCYLTEMPEHAFCGKCPYFIPEIILSYSLAGS